MPRANDLWKEFLGGTYPMPNCHCGLCGNHGMIDTRGKVSTPAGHPCGIYAPCICPNGREIKKHMDREARKAAKARSVAA